MQLQACCSRRAPWASGPCSTCQASLMIPSAGHHFLLLPQYIVHASLSPTSSTLPPSPHIFLPSLPHLTSPHLTSPHLTPSDLTRPHPLHAPFGPPPFAPLPTSPSLPHLTSLLPSLLYLTSPPTSFAPSPPHPPQPLSITLKGITNDSVDPSIDTWRTVALPLLRRAGGLEESNAGGSLELRVVKRGARPAGGGEVQLRVPLVRQLPRVVMRDEGMVKRIRGISYSVKVRGQRDLGSPGWAAQGCASSAPWGVVAGEWRTPGCSFAGSRAGQLVWKHLLL
jgi:hypothetical protein